MEDDIFNEFASEDGSTELGHHVVVHSCNDRDSSSSPVFRSGHAGLRNKHMDRINNEIYREKYKKVKKIAKGLVFENASLCDEVSQLQEKILIAKEERRFLLRKLLSFQALKDANTQCNALASATAAVIPGVKPVPVENSESQIKKKNPVKKKPPPKVLDESIKARAKKKKVSTDKRLVQPIPLDCSGRPIFPIVLGALTVHSLGMIIHDRPGFHDEHNIFPVGYCSSRTYLSLKNPSHHCLYTCTIVDDSFGPRFEVTPEDNPDHSILGNTVNECHSFLLQAVNVLCGKEMLNTEGQGAKFFGLSHPTVQNLIQSCAGARKCSEYRWVHFEVTKPNDGDDDKAIQDCDPTISYEVLLHLVAETSDTKDAIKTLF